MRVSLKDSMISVFRDALVVIGVVYTVTTVITLVVLLFR